MQTGYPTVFLNIYNFLSGCLLLCLPTRPEQLLPWLLRNSKLSWRYGPPGFIGPQRMFLCPQNLPWLTGYQRRKDISRRRICSLNVFMKLFWKINFSDDYTDNFITFLDLKIVTQLAQPVLRIYKNENKVQIKSENLGPYFISTAYTTQMWGRSC